MKDSLTQFSEHPHTSVFCPMNERVWIHKHLNYNYFESLSEKSPNPPKSRFRQIIQKSPQIQVQTINKKRPEKIAVC